MERPVETLAQRVKKVRQELKMSQTKLAELSGLRQPDISKIELGLIEKTTGIARLASALNVSPHWLETGEGSREAMLIDGQHRWFADLKDLDPQKVLLDALNIKAADPDAFTSAEARTRNSEEQQLLAAFRRLPTSERRDLIRDITARAEVLDEMVSRYLRERGEDVPPTTASSDTPPGFGEKLGGDSQLGGLDELPLKKTNPKKQ